MEYTLIKNGKSYDLPTYTLKIGAKMEAVENTNRSNASFTEKIKVIYDFCSEIIGKDNAVELVGKIDNADPNAVNILYLDIVKAYNKPLDDYNAERQSEQIDTEAFNKLMKIMGSAEKLSEMMDK